MSYISTLNKNSEVLVWERNENGRELKTYVAPYYFYTEDPTGKFISIYNEKLIRHDFGTSDQFHNARNNNESNGIKMYESDLMPDLRIISEFYYGKPAPALHVTFLDIEVDYKKDIGYASISNPYAPINAVTLYHQYRDAFIVLAVPPKKQVWTESSLRERLNNPLLPAVPENLEIIICKDEKELLLNLIAEIEDSDVLSGWNSDFFDMPYIVKRVEKVLGKAYLRKLSFPGADLPKFREVEIYNIKNQTVDLSGRISVDYLALFRKYEVADRQSFKLETVAEDVLPELPKLAYEGSLSDLYEDDFAYFVRYNIRDAEILKGFEERLGYMALANQMYHLSGATFKHVTGTLKLAELAIVNYCHHEKNLIVPDSPTRAGAAQNDESIQGAYVLEPKVGLHSWIGSIDINSLYPSSIRAINISPETLVGQFDETTKACEHIAKSDLVSLTLLYDNGHREERTAEEWREFLKTKKWAVSGFGTVFDQNEKGIIPAILEDWYATRQIHQAKKKEAEQGTTHTKNEAAYYDRLQYVYKIKLNSLYGALTNMFFRFYDLRMGESTTGTGRVILQHQCAKVNEILTQVYNLNGEAVIYGDTDSTYFETFAENKNEAVTIADHVAKKVNDSYKQFMQDTFLCNPGFDDKIVAGREIVSDRGIFVDKKRYILHVVDLEGKSVDKLKVMGLDTKKTTLPKEVSRKLNNYIERFLKGEDWEVIANEIVEYKDSLTAEPNITAIGLPKGIKGVEDYTRKYELGSDVRLPGHVAAAIHYNNCLERFQDKESPRIITGMKIKVFYLTQVYGRFNSIALPTDLKRVPVWFTDAFTVDREAHIERLVDKPLENILKAINKVSPSRQSMLTDSLLDFS